jgi:hypothetical protein
VTVGISYTGASGLQIGVTSKGGVAGGHQIGIGSVIGAFTGNVSDRQGTSAFGQAGASVQFGASTPIGRDGSGKISFGGPPSGGGKSGGGPRLQQCASRRRVQSPAWDCTTLRIDDAVVRGQHSA